jgi:hypothetical protein
MDQILAVLRKAIEVIRCDRYNTCLYFTALQKFLLSLSTMLLYEDIITGDELFSDAFPLFVVY